MGYFPCILSLAYSLHKRSLKAILLKSTTLTISDYSFLSILPLKERLNYNKGVLIHKIMCGKVPPSLMARFSLNQSGQSEKKSIYQSLGLTFPSLSSYIPVVFFGTHSLTLLDYHQALKLLNHGTCHTLCANCWHCLLQHYLVIQLLLA